MIICITISFTDITFNVQRRYRTYQKFGDQKILYPVQKITSKILFPSSASLAHNLVLIEGEKKISQDSEVQIILALKSLDMSSNLLGLKMLAGNAMKTLFLHSVSGSSTPAPGWKFKCRDAWNWTMIITKNFWNHFEAEKSGILGLSNLEKWLRHNFIVKWVHLLSFFLIWFPSHDNFTPVLRIQTSAPLNWHLLIIWSLISSFVG